MKKIFDFRFMLIAALFFFGLVQTINAQVYREAMRNSSYIRELYADSMYSAKKRNVDKLFEKVQPGHWGEFVKGVDEDLVTRNKIIALTFDACGNKSNKYNKVLIEYLRQEKVPATLFVTGKWIDDNFRTFMDLSLDSLFEMENHGFNHQPCSVDGESKYGIKGTPDVPDAFDEIEANEWKMKKLTGHRPVFYRSATAFTDEACARIARILEVTIVSYDVLSGDAVAFMPAETIANNVIRNVKPGAIVIMHFNHPEWYSAEALKLIIPALRQKGYSFARLKDYPLKER